MFALGKSTSNQPKPSINIENGASSEKPKISPIKTETDKIEINEKINSNAQIKKNAIAFDINFDNIETKPQKKKNVAKNKEVHDSHAVTETSTQEGEEEIRFECPLCGRKFKKEALDKHAPICAKVFQGKREVEITKEDKKEKKQNKTQFKKQKWENQSSELRAIIQSKRAEKDLNQPIIEISTKEESKDIKPSSMTRSTMSREEVYVQCSMCNKKFTKLNYDFHLNDCRQKQKEKQMKMNNGINNRNSLSINTSIGIQKPLFTSIMTTQNRRPLMPMVTYGGRPNFNLKFGK